MARPTTLGVIIARAGSKGLPGKHTRQLLGKPIVAYCIESALAATSLDHVVVTSDSPGVLDIAKGYDVWAVGRPKELASDTATTDSALRYGCDRAEDLYGFRTDIAVMLYGSIPTRPKGLIDMVTNHLIDHGGDSAQSYSPVGRWHPDWMVTLDDDRVVLNCPNHPYLRQDLTPMFMPNGAVVAVTRESLYRPQTDPNNFHMFLGTDRRGVVHPDSELIVDIDTARDMYIAEGILKSIREQADEPWMEPAGSI